MQRADTVNSAEAGLRGHKVMKLGHLEIIEDRDVDIVAGVTVNYDVVLQEAYRISHLQWP